ncbi:hypothetical protein [Pseudomonas sp. F(2018)]|uniref:hypothetical protein n=1 Tax=Pseudomonas sp. F(2018) TaxID=2502240 RepID=UPI0010F6AF60|nr:hypothetical protein [Pseudomonas sp. F(2018)]
MLVHELSGSIPGYRVIGAGDEGQGRSVLSLANEATGERFAIDAVRLDQLAGLEPASVGKRISEDLTLLAAGMSVEGVRKIERRSNEGAPERRVVDGSGFTLAAMESYS